MKKIVSETIDGSIKNIIQLKTLDASLEYSQLFDALEDCPKEFQSKLIGALNSLGETMQIAPTEVFNRVLCKSDEDDDLKKKMYNWWRAVFEVLSKCQIPDDKVEEYNQKVDDLMAEILKAGDGQASEEEPIVSEEYEPASLEDEDQMLENMEFAIQQIGEIANKVKELVNFVNPYCGTEVNESMTTGKPKFKKGDIVRLVGNSPVGRGMHGRIVDIELDYPDWGYTVDGRSGLFFADEEDLELVSERFTEEEKSMKKKMNEQDMGGGPWLPENEIIGMKVTGESGGEMSINLTSAEKADFESCVEDYIIQAEEKHGSESDMVIMTAASKALRWIEMICAKDCTKLDPEDVIINWADDSEAEDEFAPAEGNSKSVYDFVADLYEEVSDYMMGSETRGKPESDDEFMEDGGQKLENKLNKGDDGWTTIGQPVGEANDFITPEMKEKVREYVMQTWMASQGNDRNRISARDLYQLSKFLVNNHIKVSYGGISDDDSIRIDGEKVGEVVRNYSSRKVNGEYRELRPKIQWLDGGMVNEAKVVVDANDVWDVLELLDNDIAHTELTDLINSHVRTEEEIMDAIDELCGETVTKKELNTLLSGRMATLVDYLGLDVEQYESNGEFVDSDKPTSVELESREAGETKKVSLYVDWDDDGAGLDNNVVVDVPAEIADSEDTDALYDYITDWIDHQDFCVNDWMITDIEGLMDEGSKDEIKGGEVKDGDKQVTQDGETKTLVAGEGDKKEMSDAEAATIMGGASGTDMDAADIGVSSHEVADPYKKPVCEMTVEQEIDDPWKLSEMLWSQGKENLQELLRSELVGEEDIMQMLEDSELRNLTSINDAFAFDFPSILDSLGLDAEAWSQNLEIKRKGDDSED